MEVPVFVVPCLMCGVRLQKSELLRHYSTVHEVPQCFADSGSGRFTWHVYFRENAGDTNWTQYHDQNVLVQSREVDYFLEVGEVRAERRRFVINVKVFNGNPEKEYRAEFKLKVNNHKFRYTAKIHEIDGEHHSADGALLPYELVELAEAVGVSEAEIKLKIQFKVTNK